MLVAPAMGPTVVRSSLEVMLDSLRMKDQNPQPEDAVPTLPARPVSKGRLPSSRRGLPVNGFNSEQKKKSSAPKVVPFGGTSKIVNVEQPEECPYSDMPELERRPGDARCCSEPSTSSPVLPATVNREKLDYVLRKGLQVWCCLPDAKWELGKILSVSGDFAYVKSSGGKVLTVSTENLLPANPEILDGVGDLIQLSYLNEPSIVHNIQCRYSRNMIYTKAGPVLIALNPFKEVPLYGSDFIAAYRQKRLVESPHIFAVADTAYNDMMRDGKNQSIIIGGESGAGKTETAKFAMQYLAAIAGGSGIEEEVLQANLILESFGNAKTLRNDNSSRYGKLIEIHFSAAGKICGAKIQTFLLEKSRVVQRAIGERSYHVLYQLCAGAPPHLKERLNLKTADEYEYLKQSNCLTIADVDDAQRFHMLTRAFDIAKISKEDQENIFAMLAAVLWLGNIGFNVIDNENHVEVDLNEGVNNAAMLMGCKAADLMLALSTRTNKEENGHIVQKLTLSQAIDTRDALARSIYASLFDWLVEQLNKYPEVGKDSPGGRSISILDIYGFESFNRNGFEQLCINYASERLQQHFVRHLLKLEQKEYSQNGIDWTIVDFVDNTECLNLFEKKPLGLFSLLDEVSTLPKATDIRFANKLKEHLSDNACFKGERGGAFRICHFSGEVLYNTVGFLEKNKDFLHSEIIELLSSCSCQLPQFFASDMRRQLAWDLKQSVGTNFKDKLFKLMQQLESTIPHFIRCIKPNGQSLPGSYDNDLVLQQLRCCGVLDVVRISRSGYPTRMTHQQFAERYGFCLLRDVISQDPLSVSVNILQQFNVLPDMYQIGYAKIFFRAGQIASLEEVRNRTLEGILCVQKHFRGLKVRRGFHELKNGVITLQSFIRGFLERNHFNGPETSTMPKTNHAEDDRRPNSEMQKSVDTNKEQTQVLHAILEDSQREALKPETELRIKEGENFTDASKEQTQVQNAAVEDFQRRALKAETELRIKEEENFSLKQQIKQYEAKWLDYEAKMKSMEEMWQKQLTSLQMSLAAAKKSLAVNDKASQPRRLDTTADAGRLDATPDNHYYSDTDAPAEFHTPEGTPAKQPRASAAVIPRNSDGTRNAVSHMVKEFEQQRKVFEDDARFLIEVKSNHSTANVNPNEEIQKLKVRFASWKKDYKAKLRETKVELQKLGDPETAKTRRRWWSRRTSK